MLRRRKKIFTGRKNESLEELVRERGEHYAPPLYLSFSHLRPDRGMQKRILKIGLPQAVEVFGMWGIQMFCLSIISELPVKGCLLYTSCTAKHPGRPKCWIISHPRNNSPPPWRHSAPEP